MEMQELSRSTPALLAAAGFVDITPDHPVALAGFSARRGLSEGVHDRLEANVLAVRQAGSAAVVVTCDLLFVGDALRRGVEARTAHVLPPHCLFMAASHTHFAPMTQRGMPLLGEVDEAYLGRCIGAISDLILDLLCRLVPARLSLEVSAAPGGWSINRRLKRLRLSRRGISWEAGLAPNPEGPTDPALRTLMVRAETSGLLAVVWNHACHPTTFPFRALVSAEYPGRVRAVVRRASRPDVPVLFLQGFAGDIRPPFRQHLRSCGAIVRRILTGPAFGVPEAASHEAWADVMATALTSVLEAGPGKPIPPSVACGRASVRLSELMDGPCEGEITAHAVQLGRDVLILGISGEPLAGLRVALEHDLHPRVLLPVGYIDQVASYLPTDDDLPAGGYEVDGFRSAFALQGRFRPGVTAALRCVGRQAVQAAERSVGTGDGTA